MKYKGRSDSTKEGAVTRPNAKAKGLIYRSIPLIGSLDIFVFSFPLTLMIAIRPNLNNRKPIRRWHVRISLSHSPAANSMRTHTSEVCRSDLALASATPPCEEKLLKLEEIPE